MFAFTFTAAAQVPAAVTIALLGGFGFATVAPLQTRVLGTAKAAPTLASTANVAAFNLGNAIAACLGGLAIDAGLGYTAPNWVGALMTTGGLGLALLSGRLDRCTTVQPPARLPVTADARRAA